MSLRWFAFDADAYTGDTAHLTCEEHGAYLLLILAYYRSEKPLPATDRALSSITKLPMDRWLECKPTLTAFFTEEGGTWRHDQIERELDRRPDSERTISRKRLEAAERGLKRLPQAIWVAVKKRILARDDYTCQYCGHRGGKLECDHKVPICQGGSNDDENLATACFPCNREKGPRTIEQWRAAS